VILIAIPSVALLLAGPPLLNSQGVGIRRRETPKTDARSSVISSNFKQMMLKMVQFHIETGVTKVV